MFLRMTGNRAELNAIHAQLALLTMRSQFATQDDPAIANGTTVGTLKTVNAVNFKIAGLTSTKAATDDLFNLSGETANGASEFRAYWLYLDSSGAASFVAGSAGTDNVTALAGLPPIDPTKSIVGVFVGGAATDYTLALSAQGTVYNGVPVGVVNAPTASDVITLVNP